MSSKTKTTAMKEDTKPALVPKLRFPEFREAWEKKTLETLGYFTGGGTPSKDNAAYWTGEIPWISSSDLNEDSISQINISRFITTQAVQESATKLVPAKSILLISRVGVGKLAVSTFPLCTSQDFTNFTPTHADPLFLAYLLKSQRETLLSFNQGTSIKGFTKDNIASLRLGFPSPPEQQKIASCLSSVDELIAAQARKLDSLKTHKKGLMQQLFPREGESLPRLRFPEFKNKGVWVSQRVDKRGNVLAGKALAVNAPGPLRPYLRTKNVLDGAIDLSDVLTMPMTDAEFSRFEVLDGDILLNEGQSLGLVGRASIYRGEFGQRCAMQNALLRFRAFPSTCPEFAAQAFQQCQKDGTFASIATQTTSVAHLGSSRFSALELAWPPTFAEQQRIASCLTSLDDLIAAQIQKLEALKTHKKGLMQQLFPSPEEVAGRNPIKP